MTMDPVFCLWTILNLILMFMEERPPRCRTTEEEETERERREENPAEAELRRKALLLKLFRSHGAQMVSVKKHGCKSEMQLLHLVLTCEFYYCTTLADVDQGRISEPPKDTLQDRRRRQRTTSKQQAPKNHITWSKTLASIGGLCNLPRTLPRERCHCLVYHQHYTKMPSHFSS